MRNGIPGLLPPPFPPPFGPFGWREVPRIGIPRKAWLRGYVYAFIALFAPHLNRRIVEAALAGGGTDPGL